MKMLCFPCAGGAATMYRQWSDWFPQCEVWTANYPGRSTLHDQPLAEDISSLLEYFLDELELLGNQPVVLYGHSFGSLIAYLMGQELEKRQKEVAGLLVSSRRSPSLPSRFSFHTMPDHDFKNELKRLGGIPQALAGNEELLEFYLPLIRCDLGLNDQVVAAENQTVNCPVSLYHGESDASVSDNELQAWGQITEGAFEYHVLPGGHFFIQEEASGFKEKLQQKVSELAQQYDDDLILY